MDPENTNPAEEVAPEVTPEAPAEETAPAAPAEEPATTPEPEATPEVPEAPEEPAAQPEAPEESIAVSTDGEKSVVSGAGPHFWQRKNAEGVVTFTSQPFTTREEAEADMNAAP